jgi:hypothetical protein
MRRTATIAAGTGIAIAIFGGGLALAYDGGGSSPVGVTSSATPTAVSPVIPSDTPTATSFEPMPTPSEPTPTPSEPMPTPSESMPTPSSVATQVGRAEAEQIALRAVPGGRVESVELEQEHGRLVWSIDVMSGNGVHKIQVDKRTGDITRNRSGHDR